MKAQFPLLKEYRLDILKKSLICFDTYIFEREKQRDCVLKNYDISNRIDIGHWDKSVFRGMVIPSLKYLRLLYGSKDELRISANGKLLIESYQRKQKHSDILRTIVLSLDKEVFGFLEYLKNNSISKEVFYSSFINQIEIEKKKPLVERINKWLSILVQVNLIVLDKKIKINEENITQTENDLSVDKFEISIFTEILLESYKKLALGTAGIIKIEDLKKEVFLNYLNSGFNFLVSASFDILFSLMELSNANYLISLGKPMGAKEMLLFYKNSYYDTIHIKFYK